MYYPLNWNARVMTDETIGPDDGQFGLSYPIPEEHCDEKTEAEGTVRQ